MFELGPPFLFIFCISIIESAVVIYALNMETAGKYPADEEITKIIIDRVNKETEQLRSREPESITTAVNEWLNTGDIQLSPGDNCVDYFNNYEIVLKYEYATVETIDDYISRLLSEAAGYEAEHNRSSARFHIYSSRRMESLNADGKGRTLYPI
jgi:hypothetical protein